MSFLEIRLCWALVDNLKPRLEAVPAGRVLVFEVNDFWFYQRHGVIAKLISHISTALNRIVEQKHLEQSVLCFVVDDLPVEWVRNTRDKCLESEYLQVMPGPK